MFEAITDAIGWIVSAPFIILGWIIVGAIAGEFARRVTGSSDKSFFSDLILGIIGAIVGGFIAGILGLGLPSGGLPLLVANLVVATLGAAILIIIRRTISGSSKTSITS